MSLRAINPATLHPFVPKSQRGDPKPATFHCRAIPAAEAAKLDDLTMSADFSSGAPKAAMAQMSVGTRRYRYLQLGLRRWDNVEYDDGQPAEFVTDAAGQPTDATLSMIPGDVRDEIAEFIETLNTVSEEDRKA